MKAGEKKESKIERWEDEGRRTKIDTLSRGMA